MHGVESTLLIWATEQREIEKKKQKNIHLKNPEIEPKMESSKNANFHVFDSQLYPFYEVVKAKWNNFRV